MDKEIYKYLLMDDHKINSIMNGFFRFTQAKELNDKYEGNWVNKSDELSVDDFRLMVEQYDNKMISIKDIPTADIIFFNQTIPPDRATPRTVPGIYLGTNEEKNNNKELYIHDIHETINEEMESYCIFSTTKVLNSQLMWTHYADSETGIVISFKMNHPYFKDLIKIKYSNFRPNIHQLFKKG
jgi:hypothetical protein